MAVLESGAETRVKKSKRGRRKELASAIHQDGLNDNDTTSTPQSVEGSVEKDTARKEKKRKRKEMEAGGNTGDTTPKKKQKSHPQGSPGAMGGLEVVQPVSTETGSDGSKKEERHKEKVSKVSVTLASDSTASASDVQEFLTRNAIAIHGDVNPILSFSALDVPEELRQCLLTFKEPTPIQACSWPPLLAGRDVVGIAETGSGKTLAFGLPALARLFRTQPAQGANINALVVAPTRELAIQTHDTLLAAGRPLGITSVCLYGGVDKESQRRLLKDKRLRIVVGTPGRLLDLAKEGVCTFEHVNFLVLDEADRMLDRGFENDIRQIIGKTAQGALRQTLMFSATWPDSVRRLAASFQRDPVRVTVGQDDLAANRRVEQVIDVFEDSRLKDGKLLKILKQVQKKAIAPGSDESRTLVFVLYKNEAPRVETLLRNQGYSVCVLHGNISQDARLKALSDFKTGKVGVLIATDVAARGLDIPNVGVVINYTFPLTVEDYVHRIGRTGRGGNEGKSITFFTGEKHERALAGELMKVVRESGYEAAGEGLRRFPMTLKKKEHGAYGAHFKEVDTTVKGTKIVF